MQITFWKIAIYAITFFCYAYSGYGSNIISSLRDSLLAAESVIGDVFRNLGPLAQKFKTVQEVFDAAVEPDCIFKCPGGETPKQNRYYTPSTNGCGALGLKMDKQYLPSAEMEKCCDSHDLCYDTCNTDKEKCDADFKKCLYRHCDEQLGDLPLKGCKATVKLLYTGTLTLGCKAFLDAQTRTCYCSMGSKRKKGARDAGGEL